MKTTNARNTYFSFDHDPQTVAQSPDDLDQLVMRAAHGDTHALGAIATACGPALLEEARAVLGNFAHEAEDVLQDFFLALLLGHARLIPAHGRAVAWMCGIVRAMARRHRAEREREEALEDEP